MREVALLSLSVCITISFELITLYLLKVRDKRLWLSMLINLLTNLLLNGILGIINTYFYLEWYLYVGIIIVLEIGVIFLEGWFYQLIKKDGKNILYSLIANSVSGVIGSLIVYLVSVAC